MIRTTLALILTAAMAVTAAGQEVDTRDPRHMDDPTRDGAEPQNRRWNVWVRGNGQLYNNFYQAPDNAPQDDVTALTTELGANLRFTPAVMAYARFNYLRFMEDDLSSTQGFRIGARGETGPHSYDVFGEQLGNRPSFDVGDEFDRADTRTIGAEYSYRLMRVWQLSVDGEMQEQNYEINEIRENEFAGIGFAVRWRGSRLFSPEIGIRMGEREVQDPTQNYDQQDIYLQVRSAVTPRVYASARYRHRTRDYSTGVATASNFGREDTRPQISGSVDLTLTPNWAVNVYGAHEQNDTNRPGRDWGTSFWMAGVTWRY